MTDTNPAAVERFDPATSCSEAYMSKDPHGDYVAYEDYAALSAQLDAANQRVEMLANSLATARAEGKADGLRSAASVARVWKDCGHDFDIEDEILALIPADTPAIDTANGSLKMKAGAVNACYDRADKLSAMGIQYECCAATANNCADDILSIPADTPTKVTVQAVDALAAYQQADMDGVMVLVSRQAIEECLPALRAIAGGRNE